MLDKLIVLGIISFCVSCSPKICGNYQGQLLASRYELVLFCDSSFVMTKHTRPANTSVKGNWSLKMNKVILVPEKSIDPEEYNRNLPKDTGNVITHLPMRRDFWKIDLKEYGNFIRCGNRIRFKVKGMKVVLKRTDR